MRATSRARISIVRAGGMARAIHRSRRSAHQSTGAPESTAGANHQNIIAQRVTWHRNIEIK